MVVSPIIVIERLSDTLINTTDIPVVSTWNFFSCAKVLPEAVFGEELRMTGDVRGQSLDSYVLPLLLVKTG